MAILISLLFSFSSVSYASMAVAAHDSVLEMNSSHAQHSKIIQLASDQIADSVNGCEKSNQMGDDLDSCCKAFCATYYLENSSTFNEFARSNSYDFQLSHTVLKNRLTVPHRPPNT